MSHLLLYKSNILKYIIITEIFVFNLIYLICINKSIIVKYNNIDHI